MLVDYRYSPCVFFFSGVENTIKLLYKFGFLSRNINIIRMHIYGTRKFNAAFKRAL